MTRAFISHTFDEGDMRLAEMLREELDAVNIDGYMAEKSQKYDLRIHDKIQRAIDESGWLVAVVTAGAQRSASVHEEIGYAIGKGVRVAIMLEKGVEEAGVLVYGKEPEVFTVPEFRKHARKVAGYVRDNPAPAPAGPSRLGEAAEQLLASRNLRSPEDGNFAVNDHYGRLFGGAFDGPGKPAVLFTACPHELGNANMVTTSAFRGWVNDTRLLEVEDHLIHMPAQYEEIDIGSLTAIQTHITASQPENVSAYREFQDTGLIEYGSSYMHLGSSSGKRDSQWLFLHSVVGYFWAFLIHARMFYQEVGMDRQPFTALLSVRNASALALGNWGNEEAEFIWDPDRDPSREIKLPDLRTPRRHIQLSYPFDSACKMADQGAADAARDAARNICNAYGESAARCYDKSGRFAWKTWEVPPR